MNFHEPAQYAWNALSFSRRRVAMASSLLVLGMLSSSCVEEPDGEALYRTHCAPCHALDGTGDPRRVRDTPAFDLTRSPLVENRLDGRIYRLIDQGLGGMPAFGHKMEWQEMRAVAQYTLELAAPNDEPGTNDEKANNGEEP